MYEDERTYAQNSPYEPQQYPEYPLYPPVERPSGTPVLVFGILALAFANSFYFAFLGIIFGAICRGRLSAYLEAGGVLSGQAKVGKILGKTGLILGIVFTALLVTLIIVMIASGSNIFESLTRDIIDSGFDLSGGSPMF